MNFSLDPKTLPTISTGGWVLEDAEPEELIDEKTSEEKKKVYSACEWHGANLVSTEDHIFAIRPNGKVWYYDPKTERATMLLNRALENGEYFDIGKHQNHFFGFTKKPGCVKEITLPVASFIPKQVRHEIERLIFKAHRKGLFHKSENALEDGHHPRKPLYFEDRKLIKIHLDEKNTFIKTRISRIPLWFEAPALLVARHIEVDDGFVFELLILQEGQGMTTHTLDIIQDIKQQDADDLLFRMNEWFTRLCDMPEVIFPDEIHMLTVDLRIPKICREPFCLTVKSEKYDTWPDPFTIADLDGKQPSKEQHFDVQGWNVHQINESHKFYTNPSKTKFYIPGHHSPYDFSRIKRHLDFHVFGSSLMCGVIGSGNSFFLCRDPNIMNSPEKINEFIQSFKSIVETITNESTVACSSK